MGNFQDVAPDFHQLRFQFRSRATNWPEIPSSLREPGLGQCLALHFAAMRERQAFHRQEYVWHHVARQAGRQELADFPLPGSWPCSAT